MVTVFNEVKKKKEVVIKKIKRESFHIIDSVEMTFSHLHCVLSHFRERNLTAKKRNTRIIYLLFQNQSETKNTLARSHLLNFIFTHKHKQRARRFYCIRFASDAQINSIYYTP